MGRLLAIGLLVAAAGIATIVVNGPGTDKPEESDAATPQRSAERVRAGGPGEAVTATDPAQAGTRVRMRELAFAPRTVTVRRGEPVLFVNRDDVAHTVYEDLGATSGKSTSLDSRRIAPGETFAYTPGVKGTLPIVCTLHPSVMKMRLVVEGAAS